MSAARLGLWYRIRYAFYLWRGSGIDVRTAWNTPLPDWHTHGAQPDPFEDAEIEMSYWDAP